MISAIQIGLQGMERASRVVDVAAADVAKGVPPPNALAPASASRGDISTDMVNLMVGHRTYDANGKVVEVAARMLDKMV